LVINNQKHIDTVFSTADWTLKVEEFQDRIIKPAMIQLAQQVDQDGLVTAANTVGNSFGTAGTPPTTVQPLFDLGRVLDDMAAPRDGERYLVLNPTTNALMVGLMTGFFNDPRVISSQFRDAVFVDGSNTIGWKIGMSQNVQQHLNGPLGGAPTVSGAQGLATGWANTTSLLTAGWTAAAASRLKAGDIITIGAAGTAVNSVNPVTRQTTGRLQSFTVISDFSSDASGNGSVVISPAIIYAGPFQNVTQQAAAGAAITVLGTAATSYTRNLGWHKSAFTLGCIDLEDVSSMGAWGARKSYENISIRVARQYLIATDTVPCRCDILYGWAAPYPELAVQWLV
jgi:P22 coat protein - gene protein 5